MSKEDKKAKTEKMLEAWTKAGKEQHEKSEQMKKANWFDPVKGFIKK